MKLLALLAVLVAPPAHEVKAVSAASGNATFACSVLRDVRPAAFRAAFGGYRACLAGKPRPHRPVAVTFHGLALGAVGAVTEAPAPGCRATPDGCRIGIAGSVSGLFRGTWSAVWTSNWAAATPNPEGGLCAPALGAATLDLPGLGTVAQEAEGQLCELGAGGPLVLRRGTFRGVGNGRATGFGSLSFAVRDGVSGTFAFQDLRLTF